MSTPNETAGEKMAPPEKSGLSEAEDGLESARSNDGQETLDRSETTTTSASAEKTETEENSLFECNICFDSPTQPVVTQCGHVYCWPCIYTWLESGRSSPTCPVCKSGIPDKNSLIPIYGRGGTERQDPRETVPPRPKAQRTEARHDGMRGAYRRINGPDVTFAFGMPGLLGMGMQMHTWGAPQGQPLTPEQEQQAKMARMFFVMATLVLLVTVLFN